MSLQTRCKERNKRDMEDVARGYYDVRSGFFLSFLMSWSTDFFGVCVWVIVNNPGIHCMAFERIFKVQFDSSVNNALSTGIKGAFVESCTYGVASGFIIYSTEWLKCSCSAYWLRSICCRLGMVEHCLAPEVLALWYSGIGSLERLLDGLMLKQWMYVFFDSSLLFSLT